MDNAKRRIAEATGPDGHLRSLMNELEPMEEPFNVTVAFREKDPLSDDSEAMIEIRHYDDSTAYDEDKEYELGEETDVVHKITISFNEDGGVFSATSNTNSSNWDEDHDTLETPYKDEIVHFVINFFNSL